MRGLRQARRTAGRLALLAGVSLTLLAGHQASAQTAYELPTREPGVARPVLPSEVKHHHLHPAIPPPVDDGLGDKGFYLEADTLIRDDDHNIWTARGKVEVRYQGRIVRGDEVIYSVATGVVVANGHVQILQPDGSAEFADHVVLDDQMRAGFARGFGSSMQYSQYNLKFAADVAIRRSETVTELNRAIFTPCEVCTKSGQRKTPSWSIQASKVIQDKQKHLIYYSNAVIVIKGVPVFYTPVLWHPDPDSPRASGLLLPRVENSQKRGVTYEQPYLQVISPSAELTVDPQFNSKQNPFLNTEWKEKFYSGDLDVRVGYTYSRDFDGNGNQFGNLTSRSFVIADGQFAITNDWSWGFSAQRSSDRLIFDKYDINNLYQGSALFAPDSQRLVSQIYTTRQDSQSYVAISALSFEGLRVTDVNSTLPIVAPLIEARYDPAQDIFGGRLRFVGNAVLLTRDQSATNLIEPSADTRQAMLDAEWRRSFTLTNGMRLEPFANLLGAVYDVDNLATGNAVARTTTRANETLGVDFSWPFIRSNAGSNVILEPLAQLALSPNLRANTNIPNEDSQVTTFDETNLFSTDRFSGFDLIDGGQRLNVGARATVNWGDGLSARALVGRAFRASATNIYPANTGLNHDASDWVVAADATPLAGLSLYSRALFSDNMETDRFEVGADFAYSRARGYVRYLEDSRFLGPYLPGVTPSTGSERDLDGAGEVFITRHWGVGAVGIRDMDLNVWRLRDISLIYDDECIRVEVVYQHQDVVEGRLGQSDAVFLRLKLATLGDEGYKNSDYR
jgi:LPS-assembly protein